MKEKKFIRSNPHLPVKNLQQTLNYYKEVLGFYDDWTRANKDGKITDGGIRKDDIRLLFAEDPQFVKDLNNQTHCLPLLWFVDNIEEIFVEFQQRKIEIADTLKKHDYGLKEFAFIDINGYYIRISESVDEK